MSVTENSGCCGNRWYDKFGLLFLKASFCTVIWKRVSLSFSLSACLVATPALAFLSSSGRTSSCSGPTSVLLLFQLKKSSFIFRLEKKNLYLSFIWGRSRWFWVFLWFCWSLGFGANSKTPISPSAELLTTEKSSSKNLKDWWNFCPVMDFFNCHRIIYELF